MNNGFNVWKLAAAKCQPPMCKTVRCSAKRAKTTEPDSSIAQKIAAAMKSGI